MSQLIPALAATAGPALPLLAAAVLLRGNTIHAGRHRADNIRHVPATYNPWPHRVRDAIAHYAATTRDPYVNTVNTGSAR